MARTRQELEERLTGVDLELLNPDLTDFQKGYLKGRKVELDRELRERVVECADGFKPW